MQLTDSPKVLHLRRLPLAALLFLIVVCIGSATEAIAAGPGGIEVVQSTPTSVSMQSETVEFTFYDNRTARIYAQFELLGGPEDETVTVGVPRWGYGTGSENFSTLLMWVDGERVSLGPFDGAEIDEIHFTDWRTREIYFPANTRVTIRLRIDVPFGTPSLGGTSVEYLHGMGRGWAGPTGPIRVLATLNDDVWMRSLTTSEQKSSRGKTVEGTVTGSKLYEASIPSVTPSRWGRIVFSISNRPDYLDMDFEFRSFERPIDVAWLELLTSSQLRLLRNSFYAQKGYEFQSEDLRAVFAEVRSYRPGNFTDDFTEVQRESIRLIKAIEDERSAAE